MKHLVLSIILLTLLSLNSCEKGTDVSTVIRDSGLIGIWQHIEEIPSGGIKEDYRYFDMEALYTFEVDGTYTYKVNLYGFKDENPDELVGHFEDKGTFKVNNDSVFMTVFENTSWEREFRPEPETIEIKGEAYRNRFTVENEILTMYYVSFPADAPIQTHMSFERVE